jgi:hypothetical protein
MDTSDGVAVGVSMRTRMYEWRLAFEGLLGGSTDRGSAYV